MDMYKSTIVFFLRGIASVGAILSSFYYSEEDPFSVILFMAFASICIALLFVGFLLEWYHKKRLSRFSIQPGDILNMNDEPYKIQDVKSETELVVEKLPNSGG